MSERDWIGEIRDALAKCHGLRAWELALESEKPELRRYVKDYTFVSKSRHANGLHIRADTVIPFEGEHPLVRYWISLCGMVIAHMDITVSVYRAHPRRVRGQAAAAARIPVRYLFGAESPDPNDLPYRARFEYDLTFDGRSGILEKYVQNAVWAFTENAGYVVVMMSEERAIELHDSLPPGIRGRDDWIDDRPDADPWLRAGGFEPLGVLPIDESNPPDFIERFPWGAAADVVSHIADHMIGAHRAAETTQEPLKRIAEALDKRIDDERITVTIGDPPIDASNPPDFLKGDVPLYGTLRPSRGQIEQAEREGSRYLTKDQLDAVTYTGTILDARIEDEQEVAPSPVES